MSDATGTMPSSDERNLALLAHLSPIFVSFFGPLLVYLLKKDDSPFVRDNALEALNFQITVAGALIVSGLLVIVLIGLLLLPVLFLANVVFCILGAVAASNGTVYRYPVTIRLLK